MAHPTRRPRDRHGSGAPPSADGARSDGGALPALTPRLQTADYSHKHRRRGVNVQVVTDPGGQSRRIFRTSRCSPNRRRRGSPYWALLNAAEDGRILGCAPMTAPIRSFV
ncbi:hypothetical protein EAO71_32930 [Streptomyces sp. ms191]|nr:hypothetical protein EAO71_32930 [Streptomyces sp. ms191]